MPQLGMKIISLNGKATLINSVIEQKLHTTAHTIQLTTNVAMDRLKFVDRI